MYKFNIKSSDVDVDILAEHDVDERFIDFLERTRDEGKIRIGLVLDYLLLNELGDDLGKFYVDNRSKINNLTFKRNNSILAHGLESQSREDFDSFLELVVELARKLDNDMNKFLNQTKFPKFDIKLDMNKA